MPTARRSTTVDTGPTRHRTLFPAVRPPAPRSIVAGFAPSAPTLTQVATGEANYNADDFQAIGSSWLIEHPRGILGDDMGLGKSKMVCDAVMHISRVARPMHVLIVCEASNVDMWLDEWERWYPNTRTFAYRGGKDRDKRFFAFNDVSDDYALLNTFVTIVSYDIYRMDFETITKLRWDWAILDEGQHVRGNPLNNKQSKIAERIHAITAPRKHLLTGTPIVASPGDCWNLMKWLGYEKRDWNRFAAECLNIIRIQVDVDTTLNKITSATPLGSAQMRDMLQHNMIRRSKEDHLKLPPMVIKRVNIPMSTKDNATYADAVRKYKTYCADLEAGREPTRTPRAQSATLLRICADNSTKMDCAVRLVKEAIASEQKAVVYCTRTSTLRKLFLRLEKCGLTYLHSSVSTNAAPGKRSKRQKHIDCFQKDPACKVLIATQQCCRTGSNFTAGSIVVRLSREWNPAWNDQALARLNRPGQTRPVTVYDLYSVRANGKKTMDHQVEDAVIHKTKGADLILRGRATPRIMLEMLNLDT